MAATASSAPARPLRMPDDGPYTASSLPGHRYPSPYVASSTTRSAPRPRQQSYTSLSTLPIAASPSPSASAVAQRLLRTPQSLGQLRRPSAPVTSLRSHQQDADGTPAYQLTPSEARTNLSSAKNTDPTWNPAVWRAPTASAAAAVSASKHADSDLPGPSRTIPSSRSFTNIAHTLSTKLSHDQIRPAPSPARTLSVSLGPASSSSPQHGPAISALRRATEASSSALASASQAALSNSLALASANRSLQGIPDTEKAAANSAAKAPKSPGTSRIAKLRAAWSPKVKTAGLPSLTPSTTTTTSAPAAASGVVPPESPTSANFPGRKERGSRTFSVGPSKASKQRVSLSNIGSPTLMRYTTLNEHGQMINYESPAGGAGGHGSLLQLNNAMPLTSLRAAAAAAAAAAGQSSGGVSSSGLVRASVAGDVVHERTELLPPAPVRSSTLNDDAGLKLGFEHQAAHLQSQLQHGLAGPAPSPKSSLANLRMRNKRHASVESLPMAASLQQGPSQAVAPSSSTPLTAQQQQQQGMRSPMSLFRGTRERSATQGEYSSPAARELYALTRSSEDSGRPFFGGLLGGRAEPALSNGRQAWTALSTVAEAQGSERGPGSTRSEDAGSVGAAATVAAAAAAAAADEAQPSTLFSSGSVMAQSRSNSDQSFEIHAVEEVDSSIPVSWSQGTDITGYTAASESGEPVPDALGLVLSASAPLKGSGRPSASASPNPSPRPRPRPLGVGGGGGAGGGLGLVHAAERVSDTSLSQMSHNTPTLEHTPSTVGTGSIPPSPASIRAGGGMPAFGSIAPRSPVNRRKAVLGGASQPQPQQQHLSAHSNVRNQSKDADAKRRSETDSPSLDQILPDVEMQTFGTPMPDAEFENELVRAEQGTAATGGGARRGPGQVPEAPPPFGNNLLGLSESAAAEAGVRDSVASGADYAHLAGASASANEPAGNHACGMSRTSTVSTAGSRFQKKYTFEKVSSPEQYRLLLEEEEWMCRGLDADGGPGPRHDSGHGHGHVGGNGGFDVPAPASFMPVSRFSMSTDDHNQHQPGPSEDQSCPSLYEVSSVEGSADGHGRDEDEAAERGSIPASPSFPQSNSGGTGSGSGGGWEVSSERAIFGLYEDGELTATSRTTGTMSGQRTVEASPEKRTANHHQSGAKAMSMPMPMSKKRDTVESLLVRAADLLADRTRPGTLQQMDSFETAAQQQQQQAPPPLPITATEAEAEETKVADELDVDVELIPEGLELAGPIDPLTGLVPYQLRWKVIVRNSKGGSGVKQLASASASAGAGVGAYKVVSGVSKMMSPISMCASLPSIRTPESHSASFVSVSPGTASFAPSEDDSAPSSAAFPYSRQSFSNPFHRGELLHGSMANGEGEGDKAWPSVHLRTASYPTILPHGGGSGGGADNGAAQHMTPASAIATPSSPAFLPKPLLLVASSEARIGLTSPSSRKRFDSNAAVEGGSSPASKASSEFSRPSLAGRSVNSSPAMDGAGAGPRRRQLSYLSMGRGSLDRPRARVMSGSRSPYLSSSHNSTAATAAAATVGSTSEDSALTPRSYHQDVPSATTTTRGGMQTSAALSTASGRLAAITGGGGGGTI
ncbi:hypothetical protein OC844_000781 [Tilletia horrida]|nr:hypothetical protein OC844_000781 [Tilletia horrida]